MTNPIIFIKSIARKLILYSTEPGMREELFADAYLHRDISEKSCIVCKGTFWTIGKAEVCRKMSCYKVYKERGKQHG